MSCLETYPTLSAIDTSRPTCASGMLHAPGGAPQSFGDVEAARGVLEEAQGLVPGVKALWEGAVWLEQARVGAGLAAVG